MDAKKGIERLGSLKRLGSLQWVVTPSLLKVIEETFW
jgi:hypothetical protein